MKMSINQYKEAVKTLSLTYQDILKTLYYFPNSTADATQLAIALGYSEYRGANRHIGEIGKRMGEHAGITFNTYIDKRKGVEVERKAYYKVVGPFKEKGWAMWPELQKALIELRLVSLNEDITQVSDRLPHESPSFDDAVNIKEGRVTQVMVNRYERSFIARRKCLEHHGYNCLGCGFNFEKVYGLIGRAFIHVHHLVPLNQIKKKYKVDPIKDLIPLCPNCHSAVHLAVPELTLAQLRKLTKFKP